MKCTGIIIIGIEHRLRDPEVFCYRRLFRVNVGSCILSSIWCYQLSVSNNPMVQTLTSNHGILGIKLFAALFKKLAIFGINYIRLLVPPV